MNVIKPDWEYLYIPHQDEAIRRIATAARICYQSEAHNEMSDRKLCEMLIQNGHHAMLEHISMSVIFTVDRGVTHELVRHRIASFAQESTRYCNYSKDKFDGQVTFIKPLFFSDELNEKYNDIVYKDNKFFHWREAMEIAEEEYLALIENGATPQEARTVLPNSTKSQIVVTADLREWRHIFELRAIGTTGKPHPQMLEVMVPLLRDVNTLLPVFFEDIAVKLEVA